MHLYQVWLLVFETFRNIKRGREATEPLIIEGALAVFCVALRFHSWAVALARDTEGRVDPPHPVQINNNCISKRSPER